MLEKYNKCYVEMYEKDDTNCLVRVLVLHKDTILRQDVITMINTRVMNSTCANRQPVYQWRDII